jgi:hypothetical protein
MSTRAGELLRGALGLTTGLGWINSEDEDAPSPFMRRQTAAELGRAQRGRRLVGRARNACPAREFSPLPSLWSMRARPRAPPALGMRAPH